MYSIESEMVLNNFRNNECSFEEFLEKMKIKIIEKTEDTLYFDLLNAHPSIANALRRILIAEVPTMAIHTITVKENNTIFPDEYIAHRLGLIPIKTDPDFFDFIETGENSNTVLYFKLYKNCNLDNVNESGTIDLYSDSLEWIPVEGQENIQVNIKKNVLICKMVPGNIIDMELKAIKGIGKIHTKWSPVSICSYRIMPRIELLKEFKGEEARRLKECFTEGVIEIVNDKALVANPRLDTMSREVFRHFKEGVKILREENWFCFTLETIALDPIYLLKTAIKVLHKKCEILKEEISNMEIE